MLLRTGYRKVSYDPFSYFILFSLALISLAIRQRWSWERWCGQRNETQIERGTSAKKGTQTKQENSHRKRVHRRTNELLQVHIVVHSPFPFVAADFSIFNVFSNLSLSQQSRQQPLENRAHVERWTFLFLHECKQQYLFVRTNNQSNTQFSLLRIYNGSGDILQSTNRSVYSLLRPHRIAQWIFIALFPFSFRIRRSIRDTKSCCISECWRTASVAQHIGRIKGVPWTWLHTCTLRHFQWFRGECSARYQEKIQCNRWEYTNVPLISIETNKNS